MEIRTFASLKFKNTMTNTAKRAMLIILDGWGMGKNDKSNAIHTANTPYFDSLITDYPNSKLKAAGEAVGLPEGQMGNSEVGHLNLGAGRRIYHDLLRINKAIAENTIRDNEQLIKAFSYAKENDKGHAKGNIKGDGQGILMTREKFLGVPSYADREITPGSIYHVLMYGKNAMGSHAGQVNSEERWQIAQHVMELRSKLVK